MNLLKTNTNPPTKEFPKLTDLASGITGPLREFINRQKLAILLEDEHRCIIFVNDAFTALFAQGAPPEALLGCNCSNQAGEARGLFRNPMAFDRFIETSLPCTSESRSAKLQLKNGQSVKAIYRQVEVPSGAQGHLWIYDLQEI